MQRGSDGFTNAFLLLYALDGGVSLLDEILRLAIGQSFLLGPRNLLALPVFYVAFLALPFLALTPRLPRRLLMPLFVSALWLNQLAAPLPLLLSPTALGPASSALQVVFAGLAYRFVHRRCESWVWVTPDGTPAFDWGHWAGTLAWIFFGILPGFVLYTPLAAAAAIQGGTQGFVRFDRGGVLLDDRRYVRPADGREIRLVGMMHIGEADAYGALVATFAEPGTVVLEEGLTDDDAVLEGDIDYDGLAGLLGLDSQRDLASYLVENPASDPLPTWPVLRHADVDLAELDPATLDWLERTGSVFGGEAGGGTLRELFRLSSEDPKLIETVLGDVFTKRNEHLLAEIDAALVEFDRVVVPWGALHLPEIEAAILEDGFEPTTSELRRLLSWRTLADAAR